MKALLTFIGLGINADHAVAVTMNGRDEDGLTVDNRVSPTPKILDCRWRRESLRR